MPSNRIHNRGIINDFLFLKKITLQHNLFLGVQNRVICMFPYSPDSAAQE